MLKTLASKKNWERILKKVHASNMFYPFIDIHVFTVFPFKLQSLNL